MSRLQYSERLETIREKILNAWLYACELDILSYKPGNVSVYAAGHEMTADQFRISAKVSVEPITDFTLSLGEKIFYSIQATRNAVGCNTNLGIVLLCAPLVESFQLIPEHGEQASLRAQLGEVLRTTTVEDARWVYQAIRLANPGGFGHVKQQDVSDQPYVNLQRTMQLASHRDRIAYQYATDFEDVFESGVPCYRKTMKRLTDARLSTLAVYAGFLSTIPDSLVERKHGERFTGMVTSRMILVNNLLEAFTPGKPGTLFRILKEVDVEFKAAGINPGTTADLTVASVFADRLEQIIGACESA